MKIISGFILISFLTTAGFSQSRQDVKFYVGTYTSEGSEGIYLCNFNNKTGEVSLDQVFKGMDNPNFLKISPDRKTLYAVTRMASNDGKSDGYVEAYRIGTNGSLEFINRQDSHGAHPCHVDVSPDGKIVGIATYGGGTTSLYPVNEDGSLSPASSTVINKGSGPDKSRQSAPHAHSIRFSPSGDKVFSADLGTDRVDIFLVKDFKQKRVSQKYLALPAGSGPRHFDFHPDQDVIYVINELNSTITSFVKNKNRWNLLETISTLPEGFTDINYCADIHVSADGKFLYGSNRGHNSLAVYDIDQASKKLKWKGYIYTKGDWPRNFAFSPDQRFLLVANQKSGNIVVYRINQANGMPEFTDHEIEIPSAVCIEFL
jgi:6-phosphogluconolactonase